MLNSDQIKLITYKIGETITENRDIREIRENKNTLVPNKKNLSVIKKKKSFRNNANKQRDKIWVLTSLENRGILLKGTTKKW